MPIVNYCSEKRLVKICVLQSLDLIIDLLRNNVPPFFRIFGPSGSTTQNYFQKNYIFKCETEFFTGNRSTAKAVLLRDDARKFRINSDLLLSLRCYHLKHINWKNRSTDLYH